MSGKGKKYSVEGFLSVILEDISSSSGKREFLKMVSLSFGKTEMEVEKKKKEHGKEK